MSTFLNLDAFQPEKREFQLAGERINVATIPTAISLSLAQNAEKFRRLEETNDPELIDEIIDICVKIIQQSRPDINREWILQNTSISQFQKLIAFILEPLSEVQEEQVKKKELPSKGKVGK